MESIRVSDWFYLGSILGHWFVSLALTDLARLQADTFEHVIFPMVAPMMVGMMISLIVNLLIWPTQATTQLQYQISVTTASTHHLLQLLTSQFLLRKSNGTETISIVQQTLSRHRDAIMCLSHCNAEAKLEFFARFGDTLTSRLQPFMDSLQRISQHLGGMASTVIKETLLVGTSDRMQIDVLLDFIEYVGPTIAALASTCEDALSACDQLLYQYSQQKQSHWWHRKQSAESVRSSIKVQELQNEMNRALEKFTEAQQEKLALLYEKEKFDDKPNDQVFLVYFFVFCVIELAKEIRDSLLHTVKLLYGQDAPPVSKWRPWKRSISDSSGIIDEETPLMAAQIYEESASNESIRSRLSELEPDHYFQFLQSQTKPTYHQYLKSPFHPTASSNTTSIASMGAQQTQTYTTPSIHLPFLLRHRLRLWRFLSQVGNSFEIKFAFKTALLVTLIALLAFLPQTQDMYKDFRGQWGILSTVVVMTPTGN